MMLSSIYAKTIRDRAIGMLVGVIGVVLVTVFAIAVYRDLDSLIADLVRDFPDALLSVIGIPTSASSSASFVLGELMNLIAPLVMAGIAISIGTGAVAGEERAGTLDVLLGNPRSRTAVILAKAGSLVSLVVIAGSLIWSGTAMAVSISGSSLEGVYLGSAVIHLTALALLFGALALFLGAWTGNPTSSNAASVGVLILSFLGSGLFPVVEGLRGFATIFPWYYFNGSQPLSRGVDWLHVAVLLGGTMLLIVGAVVGVNRRDLGRGRESSRILDRLRRNPRMARLIERIAGAAQVSSIGMKTATEGRGIAVVAAAALFYLGLLVGPLFNGLGDTLTELANKIPKAILAMVGYADLSTPDGWYVAEVFSLVAPIAIIAVTMMMGARALAGEQDAGTMDLLLANPVRRSTLVLHKSLAMVLVAALVGVALFIGVAAGNLLGGLGMSYLRIGAASLQAVAIGVFFGLVTMAAGAAIGRTKTTVYFGAGVALAAWATNAFLPVNEDLAGWARVSPFHYYAANEPLTNGISWGNMGVLLSLSVVCLGFCIVVFERRDVHA